MTLDEMIANGMDPNTEVEIPLTLEQIDLLIKSLEALWYEILRYIRHTWILWWADFTTEISRLFWWYGSTQANYTGRLDGSRQSGKRASGARPINTTFNRQVGTVRSLYGYQLRMPKLTRDEICAELATLLTYYAERDRGIITDRVCETILMRQRF